MPRTCARRGITKSSLHGSALVAELNKKISRHVKSGRSTTRSGTMKKKIASANSHRAEIRLTPIHYHRSPETRVVIGADPGPGTQGDKALLRRCDISEILRVSLANADNC